MIGQTIGHYEITAKLGQGGMGEVYRASDTKLNRDVALKVLPEMFANDEQRMGRFSREAQVLASLNHPNIASIYGLEESKGQRVLVMELVEGEDLSERIARGPIPLDEALPIALQIAEALEDAHEKGIIHRDLKPANIKLTPEGKVKVLDFGLAKALESPGSGPSASDLSHSPTMTMAATQAGIILGTAAYMSPEQARGNAVDKKADVWSFGVVLWEMLTGRPLFSGNTMTDTIAAVVTKEPDQDRLPAETPRAVRRLLGRCLRKDARMRLPGIGAARLELQEILNGASTEAEVPQPDVEKVVQAERRRYGRQRWAWAALALILASLAATLVYQRLSQVPEARPPASQFTVDTPDDLVFSDFVPSAVSPDGRFIAFAGALSGATSELWLRPLGTPGIRALKGTEGARVPFWSPDSTTIAFAAGGELKKVVVATGAVQRICSLPRGSFGGGTWNQDNLIVLTSGGATANLFSVSAAGGDARLLTPHDESRAETGHFAPQFLPDGQHILFVVYSLEEASSGLFATSLDAPRERRRISASLARTLYARSGHLLFVRDGILLAQPFDAKKLATVGDAVPITGAVAAWSVDPNWGSFSVSATGLVTWISATAQDVQLEWIDREGQPVGLLGKPGKYGQIVLSADNRRVAVEVQAADGNFDLWMIDVARGVASRLTTDPANERDPVWSPDSQELLFSSDATGDQNLLLLGLRGSEPEAALPRAIGQTPGERDIAEDWVDGANTVLFTTIGPKERVLWEVSLDGDEPPETLISNQSGIIVDETQVSPDGRWLAYISQESGNYEVYIEPFGRRGERVRVSTDGGGQPKWRGDGKELFYLSLQGALMTVTFEEKASGLEVGTPTVLVPSEQLKAIVLGPDYDDYAVAMDGQRFLVKRLVDQEAKQRMHVLLDWPALLK